MAWSDKVHWVSVRVGGALILGSALLICVDVLLRKFFSTTLGGADELAGYSLAIATSWGLGATLADRAHVRIDTLYVLLPMRVRVLCDVLGVCLFIAFFSIVAYFAWDLLVQSWTFSSRSNSALQTPLYVPQGIWLLGLLVCLVTSAHLLVEAVRRIARHDWRGAHQLIGTRSAIEEVAQEVRELSAAQGEQP